MIMIIIIRIIIIAISLTVCLNMFLGCYSVTDFMLGNVLNQMRQIFAVAPIKVSLWFE